MTATLGHVRIELPDGRYDLAVDTIRLDDGMVWIEGVRSVQPGAPDFTIPAGRWPMSLFGVDDTYVCTSWLVIDADQTATCPEWAHEPSQFRLIVRWKLEDLHSA